MNGEQGSLVYSYRFWQHEHDLAIKTLSVLEEAGLGHSVWFEPMTNAHIVREVHHVVHNVGR